MLAFTYWKYCIENCPRSTKNLYIHGPKLVKYKLKKSKTDQEKKLYKEMLISVYEKRLKYFPGKQGYVLGKQGSDMLALNIGTTKEANQILKKALDLDKHKLSASNMYSYFMSGVRLFKEKEAKIEDVFDVYNDVMENLDAQVEHLNTQNI